MCDNGRLLLFSLHVWNRSHVVWLPHHVVDLHWAVNVPLSDLLRTLRGRRPPSPVPQAGEGRVDENEEGLCGCCLAVKHWICMLHIYIIAKRAWRSLLLHSCCHGAHHQFLQLLHAFCASSPWAVESGWRQEADRPI